MKKPWLLLAVVVLVFAILPGIIGAAGIQKQISWAPSTTYTDGTPIDASKTVYYYVFMDNAALSARTTATKLLFSVTDHEVQHKFELQTELSPGGAKSARSAPLYWTSPAGVPSAPGGCMIGDPDP